MKKFILIILCLLTVVCGLAGCNSENDEKSNAEENSAVRENPIVTIVIKDHGIITAELYPDVAPNTVNNFISLIKKGYYDGNSFHRCIPGFVLQGGDPEGTGGGGPGYSIKGEFTSNGFKNDLKHTVGVLSMARTYLPNSAGSQFFIMLDTAERLDGSYAAFGKVIDGMDIVQNIAKTVPTNGDVFVNNLVIEKMTVDTKGVDYPEPEKVG